MQHVSEQRITQISQVERKKCVTKNLVTTWKYTVSCNTFFYTKKKTSEIHSFIDIKSFYLSYILTKRSGMLDLPFFVRILRLISIKLTLPTKLKQKFFQINLLDNRSLKKCKYEKRKNNNETTKKITFHQVCSPRYHRHRHSKKNKINQWNYTIQGRHSATSTPAHVLPVRERW